MMLSAVFTTPLEGLVISSGAAAEPDSNAAREDALDGAPVQVSEGFCRHAKPLESFSLAVFYSRDRLPGSGEIIFDGGGDFIHLISVDVYGGLLTYPVGRGRRVLSGRCRCL